MKGIVRYIVAELAVVAVATALISIAYIHVIPRHFGDRRTYSALIAGLALAAIASGWIASRGWALAPLQRWVLIIAISCSVTAATLVLSLFFIANSRGS